MSLQEAHRYLEATFVHKLQLFLIFSIINVQNVTPQELDLLASQRAQGIRIYLVESKNIEGERIEVGESVAESESEGKSRLRQKALQSKVNSS